jgi:hypothetical protein
MRILSLLAAVAVATLPACYQLEMTAQVGFARMAVDGDVGYVSGGGVAIAQDVESAFGLGDGQGAPYVRAKLDTGVQVLSVSAFQFEESGTGVLQANFGDSPILTAGTPVSTELEMVNVKGAYAFEIDLGPVSVSPGIALDYFDLTLEVEDLIGIASEKAELRAPLPLAFLRGEVDIGPVSAVAEVGYMQVDVDDVEVSLFDLEALLMVEPVPLVHFFAGYRLLALDAEGEIDGDAFDADLTIDGFLIGGGIRF